MKSVVVSGSSGFIGERVIQRLTALGVEAIELDAASSRGGAAVDIRDADLADLIPNGSTVIHLAALSTSGQCSGDPRLAADVNITGSLNLFAAAVEAQAKRFVFASTEWVYGDQGGSSAVPEDTPLDVRSLNDVYAITKAAAEGLLAAAPGGLELAILRFGIVYGPRTRGWSAAESLLSAVATSDEVQVGSLRTSRRFIHVDDVVDAVVTAALGEGSYTLNIAGSKLISLQEVISVAEKITGKSVSVTESNPAGETVRNPDPSRAGKVMGWQPKIDFEDGLSQVAEFLNFKGNGSTNG